MARLVVAVALLLALAGCGGDPEADPPSTPTSSSSPTTSATPTATAPVMPEEAKANTKAGAIAFVKYYIAVLNRAQSTGDLQPLVALETTDCSSCQKVRTYLEGIYAGGGSIEGGNWEVEDVTASRGSDARTWVVDVAGRFEPSKVVPSSGASPRSAAGGPVPATFFVHRGTDWKVSKWTRGA